MSLFVIDFGESRRDVPEGSLGTGLHRSRGTLCIQSPEMLAVSVPHQAKGSKGGSGPSHLADIWGCGCLLGELLLGRALFEGLAWTDLYMLLCSPPRDKASAISTGEALFDWEASALSSSQSPAVCSSAAVMQALQLLCAAAPAEDRARCEAASRPVLQLLSRLLRIDPEARCSLGDAAASVASIADGLALGPVPGVLPDDTPVPDETEDLSMPEPHFLATLLPPLFGGYDDMLSDAFSLRGRPEQGSIGRVMAQRLLASSLGHSVQHLLQRQRTATT